MTVRDLTDPQLVRLYRRLLDRLGPGGLSGWDELTFALVHPALYLAYRTVKDEGRRRRLTSHRTQP